MNKLFDDEFAFFYINKNITQRHQRPNAVQNRERITVDFESVEDEQNSADEINCVVFERVGFPKTQLIQDKSDQNHGRATRSD